MILRLVTADRTPKTDQTTEIERLLQLLAKRDEMIVELTRTVARLTAIAKSPLPSARESATIETMDASTIDSSGKKKRRRGVPLESTGPIAKVALAMDVSVAEIARKLDENYQSVRTWDARNRVPDDVKERLAALLAAHKKAAKQAR